MRMRVRFRVRVRDELRFQPGRAEDRVRKFGDKFITQKLIISTNKGSMNPSRTFPQCRPADSH